VDRVYKLFENIYFHYFIKKSDVVSIVVISLAMLQCCVTYFIVTIITTITIISILIIIISVIVIVIMLLIYCYIALKLSCRNDNTELSRCNP